MNYKIITTKTCKVIGLQVGLTRSQSENHRIIASHWKTFNRELRNQKIETGNNWLKFGITKKIGGEYFYLTAIPSAMEVAGFSDEELKGGDYICFEHRGNMGLLKTTVNDIYKKIIPQSDFEVDEFRATIHYEQYDHRFLWNKPSSLISIYVPVKVTARSSESPRTLTAK